MTTINTTNLSDPALFSWASRQPEEINFLKPNAFRFLIQSLPLVTYFVQSAEIPGISLGSATQATPLADIPHPGDKMGFDDLSITFMVQESLEDYNELYGWITGLGFPLSHSQFEEYVNSQSFKIAGINPKKSELPQFSDAVLIVLDALNNPVASYNFIDCFPIGLSGLKFSSGTGSTEFFTATASFKYLAYTFTPISS